MTPPVSLSELLKAAEERDALRAKVERLQDQLAADDTLIRYLHAEVTTVGSGQRSHTMNDGCVPSHTSPLAAARAEINRLRVELKYLHAEVARLRNGWSDAEAHIAVLQSKK